MNLNSDVPVPGSQQQGWGSHGRRLRPCEQVALRAEGRALGVCPADPPRLSRSPFPMSLAVGAVGLLVAGGKGKPR